MGTVLEANVNQFDEIVLKSELPVIVDFWAPWCGPCRQIAPILDSLSKKHVDIKIVKVNIDENADLAIKYAVQSIPFLAAFKDGKMISSRVGSASENVLESWVDSIK